MEVIAKARYMRIPPRKARLVAATVVGLPVKDALVILEFTTKAAAKEVAKVVKSAAANATNNFNQDEDALVVKSIIVNEGPTIKRGRARARGMFFSIFKRTCHITAMVEAVERETKPARRRTRAAAAKPAAAPTRAAAKPAAKAEKASSKAAAAKAEEAEAVSVEATTTETGGEPTTGAAATAGPEAATTAEAATGEAANTPAAEASATEAAAATSEAPAEAGAESPAEAAEPAAENGAPEDPPRGGKPADTEGASS